MRVEGTGFIIRAAMEMEETEEEEEMEVGADGSFGRGRC
jgi:hypothetical protein